MTTVTRRVEAMSKHAPSQLTPKLFTPHHYHDDYVLHDRETLHPAVIGTSVDNLVRTMTLPAHAKHTPSAFRNACMDIFSHSLQGLTFMQAMGEFDGDPEEFWLTQCDMLTPKPTPAHVGAVVRLSLADMAYRASQPTKVHTDPSRWDIENIMVMARRSIVMLGDLGGVTVAGFHFADGDEVIDDNLLKRSRYFGGYTSTITTGDGDFLTPTHLIDMKVSHQGPTKKHLLQVLTYWRMGLHAFNDKSQPMYDGNFHTITHLGIINPRTYTSHTLAVDTLAPDSVAFIDNDVIAYTAQPEFKTPYITRSR